MLVVNRGASGTWHIFRGGEAERFIDPLKVVAHWPVAFKLKEHPVESCKLFETSGGTFFIVMNNENIPNGVGKELFKRALSAARKSEAKKNATD